MKPVSHLINTRTLIRIHKEFKSQPLKTFVARDLNLIKPEKLKVYLNLMIYLEIIEKVPAIYYYGLKYQSRKEVNGYRLLLKK